MCHAYCFDKNPGWKKMQFIPYLTHPTTHHPPMIKALKALPKNKKLKIQCFLPTPQLVFLTKFTISKLKSK